GAGDLLRGTFNSSIDKRFHEPDSVAVQKNEDVLERGRYEAENQRFHHPEGAMPPLDQIQETYEPSEPDYPSSSQQLPIQPLAPRESRFSGMFKKDRSPSVGPPDPPRKLKKMRGVA
ncbi:hypothetical protein ACHAO5_007030, partial [Verticillium nonalfalfae]